MSSRQQHVVYGVVNRDYYTEIACIFATRDEAESWCKTQKSECTACCGSGNGNKYQTVLNSNPCSTCNGTGKVNYYTVEEFPFGLER